MLVTILWFLICLFGVLFIIFHFFGNRDLYNKTEHINGPRAFPLIGNAYHFIGNSAYLIKQLLKMANIYNSPFRVALGSRVFILIKDPEQIKTVLQSPKTVEKDSIYDFAKPWFGNGLLTAEYKLWRIHRKIIQPTFNQKILQSFVSTFSKNAISLIKSVENKVGGPEFEISSFIELNSLCNICETSMGVSVDSKSRNVKKFNAMNERIMKYLIQRLLRIWLHSDFLFKFSQLSKKFNYCIEYAHNFIDEVIQKRRENLKKESIESEEGFARKRKPTLDLLLELSENGSKLNDKELREQITTIIVGGYDTITKALTFVFLMLAQHSNVQDKVYEEIYNIYGTKDLEINSVKYEDLQHFEYLERVIKETMRLFPAVPWLARQVLDDLVLDSCTIPKGCSALVFILGLHRNEKLWPNPTKFDPDRFLPENVQKRHPCAFLPFSFGTRDCIGRVYAMMSMKVFVITFLSKYVIKNGKFTKFEDVKLKADLLLDTVEPITLRLEKRVNKKEFE